METNGQNPVIHPLSKGVYEASVRGGLQDIQCLIKHVLDNKSILSLDALLNITSARLATLLTQQKKWKSITEIQSFQSRDLTRGMD